MGVTNRYLIDPKSETWLAIVEWADGRREMRRQVLEGLGLPLEETENQRGAIEELTLLILQGEVNTLSAVPEFLDGSG